MTTGITIGGGISIGGGITIDRVVYTTNGSQNINGSDGTEGWFFRPNDSTWALIQPGWKVVGQPTWIVTSATSDSGDQYSSSVTISGGIFLSGTHYAFTSA